MDPRQKAEHELAAEVLLRSMNGDIEGAADAQQALMDVQDDCLPAEGHARIIMGTPKRMPEVSVFCPDCGRTIHSGGGVSFGDLPVSYEVFTLNAHQSLDCRALKWRWWRWSNNRSPWARIERRRLSRRWRRATSR